MDTKKTKIKIDDRQEQKPGRHQNIVRKQSVKQAGKESEDLGRCKARKTGQNEKAGKTWRKSWLLNKYKILR